MHLMHSSCSVIADDHDYIAKLPHLDVHNAWCVCCMLQLVRSSLPKLQLPVLLCCWPPSKAGETPIVAAASDTQAAPSTAAMLTQLMMTSQWTSTHILLSKACSGVLWSPQDCCLACCSWQQNSTNAHWMMEHHVQTVGKGMQQMTVEPVLPASR